MTLGMRVLLGSWVVALCGATPLRSAERPTAEMLRVLPPAEAGPRITPFLRYQLDRAWAQDDARRARFAEARSERDLLALQQEIREKALRLIGGLPAERTPLNVTVTGTIPREGYRIEKVVFESLPGLHVTALLYLPDAPAGPKPAVLLACGHSPLGKAYPAYQEIAVRLCRRGYVVLCWDPVGQGERSQFWDAARGQSRYNLVCGEHAVLGNLATLAGTSLVRFMVWDGMRALDYLLTRPDVDGQHVAITGTSGGGFQAAWIGALDERIGLIAPSCFVTSLPMRMATRIFDDPDSDPEQDPANLVADGIDHAGLLLLAYPRPVHVAAAVKDFYPIEGTRKTVREVSALYQAFGHGDSFALSEGYHGHSFSTENQAAAFAFLDRWNGRRAGEALPAVPPLGAEALRCTPSGQVRLDLRGRSLQEVIRDLYRHDKTSVLDLRELYRARRQPQGAASWEAAGGSTVGDIRIDRYVGRHSGSLVLPLLHIHRIGARAARVVLRVGLDGKVGPEDWPVVVEDLRRGDDVVSFDPRGLGETRMRYKAASIDDPALAAVDEGPAYVSPISGILANYAYNALLTGRPYFLEMIEDAEIAARFCRERLGEKKVAVGELGDAGTLAAAVAAALPDVELQGRGAEGSFSWAETVEGLRETWPIQYLIPGGAHIRLDTASEPRR